MDAEQIVTRVIRGSDTFNAMVDKIMKVLGAGEKDVAKKMKTRT